MAGASFWLRQRPPPTSSMHSSPRARRRRERISYNEDNTDFDDFDALVISDSVAQSRPVRRSRRPRVQAPIVTPPSAQTPKKRKATTIKQENRILGAKKRKTPHSDASAEKQSEAHHQNAVQWLGKAMPWMTLPYHILNSIVSYASQPLASVTGDPLPSVSWLLRTALVCKAFTEVALSALYFETNIRYSKQLYSLKALLKNQPADSTINYKGKIRYLVIPFMHGMLKDLDAIEDLIPLLPQLRGIALGVHSDDPKLLRIHSVGKATMLSDDPSLVFALSDAQTQLESWTWNRTLSFHILPLSVVKEVHKSMPFITLKSLTLIDFHLPPEVEYDGEVTTCGEEALADTLRALPSLRRLQFSLADVVNERLMPLLPGNLDVLILTSCYNLFSRALQGFLAAKGQNIRELVLSHNQSLSLTFLTELAHACPRLEILKMDLLYYNSHTTFNDSTPRYDCLLGTGEHPSWPTSLRRLELLQLRRWKTPAAEHFFSSLVDSSASLPNLRHIEISASVKESGWRDRIAFRDRWIRQMNGTFLRKSPPPKHYLQSFSAYQQWKAQQARPKESNEITLPARSPHAPRSAAITKESDSDAPLMKMRRSARVRPGKGISYNESENDSSGSEVLFSHQRIPRQGLDDSVAQRDASWQRPEQQQEAGSRERAYVQGLCDVVDVVIDNLRPTEEQLHESDFLDEEQSGDEDWNGEEEDIDDGLYAW